MGWGSRPMPIKFTPLGDRGWLARLETEDAAGAWAKGLKALRWDGVVDVVPAYQTVGILADPDRIDLDDLYARLTKLDVNGEANFTGRLIEIPVLYQGGDLAEVARRRGLAEADVIAAHTGQDYRVFALGFVPGFPYAGYLPTTLSGLARRESPRTRVPAGSVAIVGRQTAIYPTECPGGWHLIGQTPLTIVDAANDRFPIQAGDRLRFRSIGAAEFASRRGDFL